MKFSVACRGLRLSPGTLTHVTVDVVEACKPELYVLSTTILGTLADELEAAGGPCARVSAARDLLRSCSVKLSHVGKTGKMLRFCENSRTLSGHHQIRLYSDPG
jgi:hypothetical protein